MSVVNKKNFLTLQILSLSVKELFYFIKNSLLRLNCTTIYKDNNNSSNINEVQTIKKYLQY